jgi:hypothetical protein
MHLSIDCRDLRPGKPFLVGKRRSTMKTKPKVDMLYRMAIGAVLLLLGLFAEMGMGAKIFVFLIAALAFVEAYLKAPGRDPYSRETLENEEMRHEQQVR